MWRGYSVSTSECSLEIKWARSRRNVLALALAPLRRTFMLSAYLDFIDIANFIFLLEGEGHARVHARGERLVPSPSRLIPLSPRYCIEIANVMGDRPWSCYSHGQTAGKSACTCRRRKSCRAETCNNRRVKRGRKGERDARNLLHCFICQDAYATRQRSLLDFCIFYP